MPEPKIRGIVTSAKDIFPEGGSVAEKSHRRACHARA
jgi:hypothetical protein